MSQQSKTLDASHLLVHHGLHLDRADVAAMSQEEIKTLINTVTNLNKSKMFASQQIEGPALSVRSKGSTKTIDKIGKKQSSFRREEKKQDKLHRSQSVESLISSPANDESVDKSRPFSISGQISREESGKTSISGGPKETNRGRERPKESQKDEERPKESRKDEERQRDSQKEGERRRDSQKDEERPRETEREFRSFLEEDGEHAKADEFLCLAERLLAFRQLFPPQTEFCLDQASKRICVVTDRYSTRSGSLMLVKPMEQEALTILSQGILPDCDTCGNRKGNDDEVRWKHPQWSTRNGVPDFGPNEPKKTSIRRSLFPNYDIVEERKNQAQNETEQMPNFLWPYSNELLHLEREETIKLLLQISMEDL